MSTHLRRPVALFTLAVGLSACGATSPGSPAVTATPPLTTSTPAPTARPDGISHPTGAHEIVLRFDEAGGFVPAEFFAAHVPYFTLYGDGRAVFVDGSAVLEPRADGVMTGTPIRTGILSEDRIQDLLTFALGEGGLATARADYPNPMVADAPTAVFEIHAGGDAKTVSVMALGLDAQPGPDSLVKAALVKLATLLRSFDAGGALGSLPYQPTAYRGVLTEAAGVQGVRIRPWPWADIAVDAFRLPADPNGAQQRTRVLSPLDATAIGVKGFEAGISGGVLLAGPDGRVYSLALRPLLPDEEQ